MWMNFLILDFLKEEKTINQEDQILYEKKTF